MMSEQQQQMRLDLRKRHDHNSRSNHIEEEELQIVDLSGMSLEVLPNPPLSLGTICKLDISNNNLQSIPESLTARLLNMVVLDVHSNQLKSLPNSIGCLSKLKILNVLGNILQSLFRTIENCSSQQENSRVRVTEETAVQAGSSGDVSPAGGRRRIVVSGSLLRIVIGPSGLGMFKHHQWQHRCSDDVRRRCHRHFATMSSDAILRGDVAVVARFQSGAAMAATS
ncbi:unnamed protein product [Fraxinus pennsylvanica]|uniref:Uncharacterized protein n=1 Tax=Fraxinus pennsylvanica TaxID=56036 RepID=A0AAD2A5U8_9LAMI|nr:unnamed protein product [Fraxinus pennsylvanica]